MSWQENQKEKTVFVQLHTQEEQFLCEIPFVYQGKKEKFVAAFTQFVAKRQHSNSHFWFNLITQNPGIGQIKFIGSYMIVPFENQSYPTAINLEQVTRISFTEETAFETEWKIDEETRSD